MAISTIHDRDISISETRLLTSSREVGAQNTARIFVGREPMTRYTQQKAQSPSLRDRSDVIQCYGVRIEREDGPIVKLKKPFCAVTHNVGEYRGPPAALTWATSRGMEWLRVRSDSLPLAERPTHYSSE